ncbi:hypothetical protein M0805_006714 [Coniferiporia weirii]|nr:hypothetical protein M0805_006714 [Coniferiporia weirii]
MFFDLNVIVPAPATLPHLQTQSSKKNKGKQPTVQAQTSQQIVVFSPAQILKLESRIDLLARLGYSVIAFNQTVTSRVDSKSHINVLNPLLKQLRDRQGVLFLKRLTIVLDEDSEKGNGLTAGNSSILAAYDIIALHPTNQTALSNACLTHTQPSPFTAHIVSLPLTASRLPFRLKHTLVRTAIKNGAVFEIGYSGALQGEDERKNWWASARELVRVTKGKGLLVSGCAEIDANLRAPRDVGNLISSLGLAQNFAHDALTTTPKSLLLRTRTRKTYRAILSEPTLIPPAGKPATPASKPTSEFEILTSKSDNAGNYSTNTQDQEGGKAIQAEATPPIDLPRSGISANADASGYAAVNGTKRTFDSLNNAEATAIQTPNDNNDSNNRKMKSKKRAKTGQRT